MRLNGMQRKAARRKHAIRYDENGLPRDPNEWTAADWSSLWKHYQAIVREIASRHGKAKVK